MKKIDLKLAIIILQNDSYCENINKDSCCKIIKKWWATVHVMQPTFERMYCI